MGVHGESVSLGVRVKGVEGRGQGLRAVAQVLAVAGRLQFGALSELQTDPLARLRGAHRCVLFTGLRRWPLDGPVLFSLVTAGSWINQENQGTSDDF